MRHAAASHSTIGARSHGTYQVLRVRQSQPLQKQLIQLQFGTRVHGAAVHGLAACCSWTCDWAHPRFIRARGDYQARCCAWGYSSKVHWGTQELNCKGYQHVEDPFEQVNIPVLKCPSAGLSTWLSMVKLDVAECCRTSTIKR